MNTTTSKIHILFAIFFSFSLVGCAQSEIQKPPRNYVAYQTSSPPIIDGNGNEEDWQKANWSQSFIDIEGVKEPTYDTKVKMLWDENYYYILAELKEPHVWATLKQRDTIIFYNNDFEVFIDPDNDTHNYYETELNALNTVWDLMITKPYRENNNPVVNDYTVVGLKTAIKINGTLNDPSDIDESWTVEMAIPWSAFKAGYYHDNVPRDAFWRVNFSRVNWDHDILEGRYSRKKDSNGKFLHEYNWVWSPTGVIDMHLPEKWGYVFFSTNSVDQEINFEIPKDEEMRWELFRLYRAQKQFFKKHKKYAATLTELNLKDPLLVNGAALTPQIELHSTGWNAIAESPYTKSTFIMKEDGKIIIKN